MLAPILALAVACSASVTFAQSDDITLYSSSGKATAYIADDMTIYLWSGKPVAYLYRGSGGTDVYGFDGKHIGWFERGYIRTNDGDRACGVKDVVSVPQIEPIKSLKELKPLKAIREIAPIKPIMSVRWSATACRVVLGLGGE